MTGLIERLQTQSVLLARRAIAEMYQNPFWQDRFGTRGRELAEQDGALHLSYLLQALAASDPSVLTSYARSLQTRLVSRGMCSRHISEHFERLERAIADLVPESDPAGELLRAARQALTYDEGLGRELQLLSDPLAEKTLDALESRQPSWFSAASSYVSMASFESILQAERARWKGDLLELISYLADALRADRLELFSAHVVHTRGFFMRRQGPSARMEETLYALAECLPAAPESPSPLPDAAGSSSPVPPAPRRASLRPVRARPSLSEPPAPPLPLPMSGALAVRARAALDHALECIARDAAEAAARRAAGGSGP
jgi:hypothetical protein